MALLEDLSRKGDRHRRGGLAERRAYARIGRATTSNGHCSCGVSLIAKQEGYVYYVMEAFDSLGRSARRARSVRTGASTARTAQKFASQADRAYPALACARSSIMITARLLWLSISQPHAAESWSRLSRGGRLLDGDGCRVDLYDLSQQYVTATSVLVGPALVGMAGVIAVLLAEAHEWAEAHWVTIHRRILRPKESTAGLPPVSSTSPPSTSRQSF
jgi:hypothetical protein